MSFTNTRAGGLALRIGSKDVRPWPATPWAGPVPGVGSACCCTGAARVPSFGCKAVPLTAFHRSPHGEPLAVLSAKHGCGSQCMFLSHAWKVGMHGATGIPSLKSLVASATARPTLRPERGATAHGARPHPARRAAGAAPRRRAMELQPFTDAFFGLYMGASPTLPDPIRASQAGMVESAVHRRLLRAIYGCRLYPTLTP